MEKKVIIPVILSGGTGSRLWPLSRSAYPKQFLPLLNPKETLLQSTLTRVSLMPIDHAPIIVCNEEHRFIVAEQTRLMGIKPMAIILESIGKNTAPAIALAANFASKYYSNAVLWVMPADHVIRDPHALWHAFELSLSAIEQGKLVAFGVEAKYPETAYGYIKVNASENAAIFPIERFVEKPDLASAETYVQSKQYYWNAGIFAFRTDAYLGELAKYAPEIANACNNAIGKAKSDGDFVRPLVSEMVNCPSNSIDYAVMEKTKKSVMTLLVAAWNDVGSWDALMRESHCDASGNVVIGDVVAQDVTGSYLRSEHKMLAVAGVSDHVIVVTDDAVLVAHKDHCQNIKSLVNSLKNNRREEAELHLMVHRPWGSYHSISEGPYFKVKRITVKPQHQLSLQRHRHRSEHWIVIAGVASIVKGEQELRLKTNESAFIPANVRHRLSNETNELLELIEVQVGNYLGEDDIERFEDVYGRAGIG